MMTEEQKRKERLIDLICLTCVDVRNVYSEDAAQDKINEVRALAEQLAELTQPASPALKLPWSENTCRECGSKSLAWGCAIINKSTVQNGLLRTSDVDSLFYLGCDECSETVAKVSPDEVVELLSALQQSINAPHTAQIEPICATGGAEWVKCNDRMPVISENCWRTPLPVLVMCELGIIPAYARTYTTLSGEKKVGFAASLVFGNNDGDQPESLYSSEILTQATMWREMPAGPTS